MRSLCLCALLLACLSGCHSTEAQPSAHPFALTEKFTTAQAAGNDELKKISTASAAADERLGRIEAGVSATNAHLADMVEHFRKTQGQDGDLLAAVDRLRQSVDSQTPKTPPLRAAGAAIETLFPSDLMIRVDGQLVDMTDFVRQWYKQPWQELSGTVDDCLLRFGVAAEHLERLSQEAKDLLHGAIHEHAERAKAKHPPREKSIERERNMVQGNVEGGETRDESQKAAPPLSACPGGVCPVQQPQQWTYQYSRRTRRR